MTKSPTMKPTLFPTKSIPSNSPVWTATKKTEIPTFNLLWFKSYIGYIIIF
jgi:hypothetical protein